MHKKECLDHQATGLAYTQVIPAEGRVSEGHVPYAHPRVGDQLGFDFGDKGGSDKEFRGPAFSENTTQPLKSKYSCSAISLRVLRVQRSPICSASPSAP